MGKWSCFAIAIRAVIIININICSCQPNGHARLDRSGTNSGAIQVIIGSISRKPSRSAPSGGISAGRIYIGVVIDQTA